MVSKLWSLIREHPNESVAVVVGLAVLVSVGANPQWWGARSQGVFVGVVVTMGVLLLVVFISENTLADPEWAVPWVLVVVPTATALVFRKVSNLTAPSLPLPRFYLPVNPSPQAILLIVVGLVLLIFVFALIRSLARGESVSVESHWGGLGGGIAGWRLSAPLVYLLVIAFLLATSSALAWRIFPPPLLPQQSFTAAQQPQQQTHPPTSSATGNSSVPTSPQGH